MPATDQRTAAPFTPARIAPQPEGAGVNRLMWLAAALGLFAFTIALAMNYEADSDLWAKLAIGAEARLTGHIPHADRFAFTPTLPDYMDHEWGAGVAFDAALRAMGPRGADAA